MSIFAVTLEARNRLTSGPPMLTRMPRPPSGGCFLIEATSKDGGEASDVCVAAGSDVWEADCAFADVACAGLEWTLRIGTAAAMQKAAENRRSVLSLMNGVGLESRSFRFVMPTSRFCVEHNSFHIQRPQGLRMRHRSLPFCFQSLTRTRNSASCKFDETFVPRYAAWSKRARANSIAKSNAKAARLKGKSAATKAKQNSKEKGAAPITSISP